MNPLLLSLLVITTLHAERFLDENGQPRAEIVVSETPTRMQRVAPARVPHPH